jgi:hypothetical protein
MRAAHWAQAARSILMRNMPLSPVFAALACTLAALVLVWFGPARGGAPFAAAAQSGSVVFELTDLDARGLPELILSANVSTALGQSVPGLTAEDFRLVGDFAPFGSITRVENQLDTDLPFSTVLVVDVSTSMVGAPIEAAREAARRYVARIGPNNPVALVTFGDDVEVVQPYTTDTAALTAAIDALEAGGTTALYQAAADAIAYALQAQTPRRAVVLLGDGAEYGREIGLGSRITADEALAAAQSAVGVPVYTVGLGFGQDRGFLRALAAVSAAEYFDLPAPEQLSGLYDTLAALFTSSYRIFLTSTAPLDGTTYALTLETEVMRERAQASIAYRSPVPVPIVRFPDAPTAPIADDARITAEVLADDAVTSVTLTTPDGAEEAVALEDGRFTFAISPYSAQAGVPLAYTVSAVDADGDTGTAVFETTLAEQVPIVRVSGAASGASLDVPIVFTAEVLANSPIAALTVQVAADARDEAEPVAFDDLTADRTAGQFLLDPLRFAPGLSTVTVRAETANGLVGESTLTLSIPPLPPQIRVIGLEPGETLSENRTVTLGFTSQTPVNHVAWFLDGRDLAHQIREPFGLMLDVVAIGPGPHTLRIAANDRASMSTLDIPFTVAASVALTQQALTPTATHTPSPSHTPTPSPTATATAVPPTSVLPGLETAAAGQVAIVRAAGTQTANINAENTQAAGTQTANINAENTQAAGTQTANINAENTQAAGTQTANINAENTRAAGTQSAAIAQASTRAAAASARDAATQNAATQAARADAVSTQRAGTATQRAETQAVATQAAVQAVATQAAVQAVATQAAATQRAAGTQSAATQAAATQSAVQAVATQGAATQRAAGTQSAATQAAVQTVTAEAAATRAAATRAAGTQSAATQSAVQAVSTQVAATQRAAGTQSAATQAAVTQSAVQTATAEAAATRAAIAAVGQTQVAATRNAGTQQARANAAATQSAGTQRARATATVRAATAAISTVQAQTALAATSAAQAVQMNATATAVIEALQARTARAQTAEAAAALRSEAETAQTATAQARSDQAATLETSARESAAATGTLIAQQTAQADATQAAATAAAQSAATLSPATLTPQTAEARGDAIDVNALAGLCGIGAVILLALLLLARRRRRDG